MSERVNGLSIDFLVARWHGTTWVDGREDAGISFRLADGGMVRLRVPVGSARVMADSLLQLLGPPKPDELPVAEVVREPELRSVDAG